MKRANSLARVAVGVGLLALLATGCNVEREWVTSRDPSEAEAQKEMREQAAFYDIEGSPELDAAAREYQDYVDGQSEVLVDRTEEFVAAVKAGKVNEAKNLYASSRVPWERIEPIAEKFGTLDPEVDAREGDVPKKQWTGFHRIEQALWVEGTTEGQGGYAEELISDVERLERKVDDVKLQASDPVFGAVELLNEVSATKITGEEERYSHTDLYDIAANVEGARVAFEFVKPVVRRENPDLVTEIDARFEDLEREMEPYRRGDGWVSYEKVDEGQRRELSQKIDALAEPLSRVGRVLSGS
ncbi:MAG TPA: iron uptake system protein EfeO [Rubrobacter sp.]|nr:iron uptake system protein EfeO [Rubrobacter sp.]